MDNFSFVTLPCNLPDSSRKSEFAKMKKLKSYVFIKL